MERNSEQFSATFAEANCRKLGFIAVEVMYPEAGDERAEAIGRSVCSGCVAYEPCLELRLGPELHNDGILAGMTRYEGEKTHRTIVRERRRGAR